MALNKKKNLILSGIQVWFSSYSFHYATSSIRLSARQYYFDHGITSERLSHGLSEYRIVLKLDGFRISGLLFLRSRSCHNKPATVTLGALKPDHAYVMIQKAKLSNKNLML